MKLGPLAAPFPETPLEEVADWAARSRRVRKGRSPMSMDRQRSVSPSGNEPDSARRKALDLRVPCCVQPAHREVYSTAVVTSVVT
jgi:hypothetical protein